MKWSNYLQITKYDSLHTLLFSTLTRALIKINTEKYVGLVTTGKVSDFFTLKEEMFLRQKHFIVDDDFDEIKFVNVILNRDRLNPKTFSTYVALTTLCNFSCVYCYEKGQVNEYNTMSHETLANVLEWYRHILVANKYTECKICLYGGEPLLYFDLLKDFVNGITDITKELNVKLTLTAITNGYLLVDDVKGYLLDKGLKEVQITLDGYGMAHDRRRMLQSGGGTFDTIFKNIKNLTNDNIEIVIRISFDNSNMQEIQELLRFLVKNGMQNKISIYFAPIHQTTNQKKNGCSFCSQNVLLGYDDIANAYCKLYTLADSLGFKIPSCYTNGPCMVVGQDSCLIAPNGELYKCVEMLGIPELSVGNVRDREYNGTYYEFMYASTLNGCINSGCKYVPICGSGCTMETYLKNNSFSIVTCHKCIFDKVTSALNLLKSK